MYILLTNNIILLGIYTQASILIHKQNERPIEKTNNTMVQCAEVQRVNVNINIKMI